MKRTKHLAGLLAIAAAVIAIVFLFKSGKTLVANPKGMVARGELELIITNLLLMLIIVLPTYVWLFSTAWKYRSTNPVQIAFEPERGCGFFTELALWVVPSLIVAVMAVHTWNETHKLDPYKPLSSDLAPLKIEVVALNWKWLFIYPEQGIATVNLLTIPEQRPIHLSLAADKSPMNSFWIPQLSGQIYAMTGMATQLHLMADGPGEYKGRAAEINGMGYAYMSFDAKSVSASSFDEWIASVKQSPIQLTESAYDELTLPSRDHPVALYSSVEKNLFEKVMSKYYSTP